MQRRSFVDWPRKRQDCAVCRLALGALLGEWDSQPRREIPLAARTRDQARVAWNFCVAFARSLPDDVVSKLEFRRQPRYEIEYTGDGGGHVLRAIAADGKSALGSAPSFVLLDERGHWMADQGNDLEHALLSGLGKRGGRAIIISTSAPDDAHPFSKWLDEEQAGVYRQEHRPAPGLPADDPESLLIANPGAEHGIGASLEWLQAQARRAIARGGSSLTSFRLYNRNERISGENRDVLLTTDEWMACETDDLFFAPREGPVVIGIDLGGSASMSAAAFIGLRQVGSNASAGFRQSPACWIAAKAMALAVVIARWEIAASYSRSAIRRCRWRRGSARSCAASKASKSRRSSPTVTSKVSLARQSTRPISAHRLSGAAWASATAAKISNASNVRASMVA
ncbi:MAG: hypothetical protein M5U33_11160 [Pseudorhodoplanes sp.]|nr:hypothetical protein [Pseudorhodoplanes sp.]